MLSKYNNFLLIFNIIFSLAILLALGVYAEVWNEPPSSPPNDNPPDLLHVGNAQTKSSGLALNIGGAPIGLTVATGTVEIFGGGGLNVFGDITSGRTINAKVFCLGNNCIDKWPCSISATAWSSCSKPCGGGTQTRIVTNADCTKTTESRSCNTHPCTCTWGSKTYTSGATCISASSFNCSACAAPETPGAKCCYNTVQTCYNGTWSSKTGPEYCSASPCKTTCGK